jgi:hypothetical protein
MLSAAATARADTISALCHHWQPLLLGGITGHATFAQQQSHASFAKPCAHMCVCTNC